MPELPHVEIFRRRVEGGALRRTVETVSVPSEELLVDTSPSSLRDALLGHTLQETLRHGKHLFIRSGEERRRWLRLHFGMTGSLRLYDRDEEEPSEYVHLRLDLEGGRALAYRCPRKFGEIGLVQDPRAFVEEKGLGPDPWGGVAAEALDADGFREALEGRRGMVKSALMDQEVLSGLGNVYVDEVLFQEGIHPETRVDRLEADRLASLWSRITSVLDEAVKAGADPGSVPEDWLLADRNDGRPCPRCDGTVVKREISGRPTYLCDTHQERDG